MSHWEQLSQSQRAPCRAGAAHPWGSCLAGDPQQGTCVGSDEPRKEETCTLGHFSEVSPLWQGKGSSQGCKSPYGRAICPHGSCQGSACVAISLPASCFGSAASLDSGELYFPFVLETLLKLPLNYFSEFFSIAALALMFAL